MATLAGKLTPHQRWALLRLARLATVISPRPGGWILARDCGAPAALDRLHRRGLVDRKVEYGPRGGEHVSYRPTPEGYEARDYIVNHDLKRH